MAKCHALHCAMFTPPQGFGSRALPILSPILHIQTPIRVITIADSETEIESIYHTVADSSMEPNVELYQDSVDEAVQQSEVVSNASDFEILNGPFNQLGLPENQYWGAHLPPSSVNSDRLADVEGKC